MDVAAPASGERVLDGSVAAIPVAALVAVFGASFGVLARTSGFPLLGAVAMSATTFAGSAQFAAVSILAEGGGLAAAVVAAVLLNARYGPIGLSVAPYLPGAWLRRVLASQLVVDESWAIASRTDGSVSPQRLIGAGLAVYLGWVGGTALGAAAGNALADPAALGLDAAFPALFLGLLAPRVREPRARRAAAAGALIALVLVPFTPPGVPVIAAAAGAVLGQRR
ncbi:MAG: hypothetical protein KatS3mg062_1368 [Tepidiforma sp.]|nr:MAG: hypothetical protein KatS3mg062_1368 [Tepidiforma sp.]